MDFLSASVCRRSESRFIDRSHMLGGGGAVGTPAPRHFRSGGGGPGRTPCAPRGGAPLLLTDRLDRSFAPAGRPFFAPLLLLPLFKVS